MAIPAVVVNALVGPALGYAGKRAAQELLGPAEERALVSLCSNALGEALDEALAPYPRVQKWERDHLLALLEEGLRGATHQTIEGMHAFGPTDLVPVVETAHDSATIDWETFGVFHDHRFHRLDEVGIFKEFLEGLPTRLGDEAKRAGSPLANLNSQLNHGELLRRLNSLLKLLASSVPVGTAKDTRDARKRALDRQRNVVAMRRQHDLTRSPYVDSGLMEQWLSWRATQPWLDRVVEALQEVVSALDGVAENEGHLLEDVITHAVDHAPSYSSLRLKLSDSPLDAAYTAISKSETTAANATGERERALLRLRWLKQQVQKPRFNHCFNVTGSFGSGTSRFLTRVAQDLERSNDLALFVTVAPGESFTKTLLRRLSQTFGMDFRDIQDTQVLLAGEGEGNRRLYLLVEDADQQFQNEAGRKDLFDVVEASTAVPGIRWCMTANLDDLSAVLSKNDPFFWERYCFVRKHTPDAVGDHMGGWVNLDALNARSAVGLCLLRDLAAGEAPDLGMMITHPEDFASEGLAFTNPLPAWMRYEAMAADPSTRPVSDPQDPAFIAQYWSFLKLRHLKRDTPWQAEPEHAEVEGAVTAIASQLHRSGRTFAPLYGASAVSGEPTTLNKEASAALRRMGLLSLSYQDNPVLLAAVPVFAPFWGFRIGRIVVTDLHRSTDVGARNLIQALGPWYERANRGEALAEAVCQFTLGELAEVGDDNDLALWQSWESDMLAPRVPFLMAGAAAPEPFSRLAVQLVTRQRYKPRTKREAFVMMRLVAKAPSLGWKADRRLAVLNAQRGEIVFHGLHTYASYATQSVLTVPDLVERENFVDTCIALMGCEQTGTAEVAAKLMVDNGLRLFTDQEDLVRDALKFLRRISKRAKGARRTRESSTLTRPDRDTFPQRFIDSLLGSLVQGTNAAETVRMLARLGWWTGHKQRQIAKDMAIDMGKQLNLEFGGTAHLEGPNEAYVSVVEDLLDGTLIPRATPQDRLRTAMFLVKHSVPTNARWDVKVDPSLHAALARLCNDKDFPRRWRSALKRLGEANRISAE